MKTQTFKNGNELIMRITLSAAEIDAACLMHIYLSVPGLARQAPKTNCRPLFETRDSTYELRIAAPPAKKLMP